MRATLDREDLLGQLDGIGHGVVAARKAERSLWYGNGRVAKMLTEVQEHPLALSIRARASYLLGDVASASALNEHLVSNVRLLGPLHLEALLLAYETSAIHHRFITRDLLRAFGSYEKALSLARLLGMSHKAMQLQIRSAEVRRALAAPADPIAAPKSELTGDDEAALPGGAPSAPDLDRLRRALDHHRNGELFLAGHELDAPPTSRPAETSWRGGAASRWRSWWGPETPPWLAPVSPSTSSPSSAPAGPTSPWSVGTPTSSRGWSPTFRSASPWQCRTPSWPIGATPCA